MEPHIQAIAAAAAGKQRDPRCFDDRPGELHMYVAPKEVQIGNTRDQHNRRLINLHNVPLGYNYIAPQINDGEEFAIGGDNTHIIKTLANHLKYRSDERWHIVGIPESHLQRLVTKANNPAHVGTAGQDGLAQVPAVQAQPKQGAQGAFGPAELAAHREELAKLKAQVLRWEEESSDRDSDRGVAEKNVTAFSKQQGQKSGYPPQSIGVLGPVSNGGLTPGNAQAPQSVEYLPQGSFGGFGQGSVQVPPPSQAQQGSLGVLGQGAAQAPSLPPAPSIPQTQLSGPTQKLEVGGPGQDGAGQSVPVDYKEFMATQRQGAPPYDALAPGAEVLYRPGEDDWLFEDQGLALGQPDNSNSNNNDANAGPQEAVRLTPQLQPVAVITENLDPMTKVLRAHTTSPGRFEDKSGTGKCDWCGRHGHEAIACLKWDPEHYDKAVCIVCNNVSHSIDECPRFTSMAKDKRAVLLLDKGAGRPGVRSRYHAWTDYCHRAYWGRGYPMTRRFVRGLADDERAGAMVRNLWKLWEYRRGVPKEFRDGRFDSVEKIVLAGLDERFQSERPFSMYGDKRPSTPGAEKDEVEVGYEEGEEEDGEGDE